MSKITELRNRVELVNKLHVEAQSALFRARENEAQIDELIYAAHKEGATARSIAEVTGVSSLTTIYRKIERQKKLENEKDGGF